jgi:hypothetical protein
MLTRAEAIRNELRDLVRSTPFQAFAIELESGSRVQISHPENIAFASVEGQSVQLFLIDAGKIIRTTLSAVTSVRTPDSGMAVSPAGTVDQS